MVEGGGALISQAIHQVDLLLHLLGAVDEVFGYWQLGGTHAIESEDTVCAVLRYASGATGVIQASTSVWPGYPERLEIHGTRGSAIITGDQLTAWDVQGDAGDDAADFANQCGVGRFRSYGDLACALRTAAFGFRGSLQDGQSACVFGSGWIPGAAAGAEYLRVLRRGAKDRIGAEGI